MTGMDVMLGGTCMLVLLTESQERFWLSTFAVQCSLADQSFVSVARAGV